MKLKKITKALTITICAIQFLACSEPGTIPTGPEKQIDKQIEQQIEEFRSQNPKPTSSNKKGVYFVPHDPCDHGDCAKEKKIPPRELWCVLGYKSCPNSKLRNFKPTRRSKL